MNPTQSPCARRGAGRSGSPRGRNLGFVRSAGGGGGSQIPQIDRFSQHQTDLEVTSAHKPVTESREHPDNDENRKKRQAVPDRARGPTRADPQKPRARTTCSRLLDLVPKRIRAISPFGIARDRGCDLARDANVLSLAGSRCRSFQKRPALARPVPEASTRPVPRPPRRRRSLRDTSSRSRRAMSSRTPPRASSPDPRVPRPSTLFRSTTRDALLGRVPPLSARVAASSRPSTGKSRPRRRVAAESRTPSAVAAESRTPGAVAAESRTPGTRRERSIRDDPGRPPPSTRRRRPKPPRTASSMRLPRRFVSLTAPSRRFARLCATGRVVSRRLAR